MVVLLVLLSITMGKGSHADKKIILYRKGGFMQKPLLLFTRIVLKRRNYHLLTTGLINLLDLHHTLPVLARTLQKRAGQSARLWRKR